MTRGVKHIIDMWETHMQAQWFPFKQTNLHTGQEYINQVQGALRPIQLWEYVFPETHLGVVLNMLNVQPKGKTEPPIMSKYQFLMRKMMNLKAIPEMIPPVNPDVMASYHVPTEHMHIVPIGIKEDITEDIPKWNVHQERL